MNKSEKSVFRARRPPLRSRFPTDKIISRIDVIPSYYDDHALYKYEI